MSNGLDGGRGIASISGLARCLRLLRHGALRLETYLITGSAGSYGSRNGIFWLTYQPFLTEMGSGFNRRKAVMSPSVGPEYSKQLKSLTLPCDIISPFDRYANPLGPDIGFKHLADVTLVRYPLRIGLGLNGHEQTLR